MRRVAFLLVLLLLVGCSSGEDEIASTTTVAPTTESAPTTTAATTTLTSTTEAPATSAATTQPGTTATTVTTAVPATTTPATTAPPITAPEGLAVEVVTQTPSVVTAMAPTADGVVLAMQTGEVGFLADGEVTTQATIPVSSGGERGLLGVAIHPDDPERWFFYYTNPEDGGTVVSEFAAPGGEIDPGSEQVLYTVAQPAANHNGGMIQFGPDGMLYVALGDGGGGGDQFGNGQNTDTALGGILRLDVDGEDLVPADNPGFGAPELWLYGLRNPWRFDWSGERLIIADVGQSAYEEITVVSADDGGANLGWPILEGTHCYAEEGCEPVGILPVHEVEHGDNGTCSITGGVTYEGEAIPGLAGHFLFSDYCGGYLRSIRVDGDSVETFQWIEESMGSVFTFGEDEDGEVLISADGNLLRIVPAG